MGNCCSVEGAIDHWIYVKTGDRKGAGTDANIRIVLYDDRGNRSPEITLDCRFRDDFERGQTDTFQAPPMDSMGDIVLIELWRDNAGIAPNWYCEVVVINDARADKCYYFPVQRWVKADHHYMIPAFDTSLPQDDKYPEQRRMELEYKNKYYQYEQKAPDLPMQIRSLPEDELFSNDYKWDIETTKADLLAKSMLTRLTTGNWDGIEDLKNLFKYTGTFPEPKNLGFWTHDGWFGAQRLVGANPTMIQVCNELPENMGVTADMLKQFLEGWTVKQIIEAKRLFICDYKILDDLPIKDDRPFVAPLVLLFLNGEKQLMPLAIQLQQDITPDNPVFLCNDSSFTWILAKMWANLADASIHQSLIHLGFTHLLMEGVCISTHRNIATNHPIFKLLAPHFVFLLAINSRGLDYLVSPGGWVDKTTLLGREGMLSLIRRGLDEWRIDVHGNLPKELESRGVLDPRILPNYAYRDDAILLHKSIENYVTKVVRIYYDHQDKLKNDPEVQNWAKELATPKENGGVGIKGMPHDGRLEHTSDLIMVCTSIIYTCSVAHAASNFCQYEEYAFPPNYPAYLVGEPPTDKLPRTEEDIVAALPSKSITLDTMVVTKLLSMKGTKSLGEWEFQYQYEPSALKAEKEFREELVQISKIIKDRELMRGDLYKYPYLDPDIVPNAISI